MRYVLMTAAKDEAAFIERPLEAVVGQTILPLRWIIVSDGSTDDTDRIVKRYASRHPFIELVRREGITKRDFGSKSLAIQEAYGRVKELSFDCVGNLDADISFDARYYERALQRLEDDPQIGLVSGRRYDLCGGRWRRMPPNTVSGAVHLFRRECWEAIGGYLPLRHGGEDSIAEIAARMKGWRVESLADLEVFHHRETGTALGGRLRRHYIEGAKAQRHLGYHPVFFVAITVRDAIKRASLLGSIASIVGYAIAACTREERGVSEEFVRLVRRDQMYKMSLWLHKCLRPGALIGRLSARLRR